MTIKNQPYDGSLGDDLIDELMTDCYSKAVIFVAFAKSSGVLRLKPALEKFRASGGTTSVFVGIDLNGTSIEALLNLIEVCDNLVIVHSSNGSTFHPKVYYLCGTSRHWLAVGSNNLTKGGLWTNIESSFIDSSYDENTCRTIDKLSEEYLNPDCPISMVLRDETDIAKLINFGLVTSESEINISSGAKRKQTAKTDIQLFGTLKTRAPRLSWQTAESGSSQAKQPIVDSSIEPIDIHGNADEVFWFEARRLTGGSRNILDLSKAGRVMGGSASGTRFSAPGKEDQCYGGALFFGIDPRNESEERDITINYDGADFYPSTIKYPVGDKANGTWRIQLKGESPNGDSLAQYGIDHFVDSILLFERISNDYFILTTVDKTQLSQIKDSSKFWAVNGNNTTAKSYGMLEIETIDI